ncbi:MAG: hypothetical protein OXB90_05565 [Acidimicrobiaceae bacterium]|nr:hypothetical protein [Acidimicrobiaceae bacterium]
MAGNSPDPLVDGSPEEFLADLSEKTAGRSFDGRVEDSLTENGWRSSYAASAD